MRSNHSFSIDFVTRKCKADKNKAFIYARITVDGEEPVEISTKEKIDPSKWNNKQEIVKGNSIEAKAINKAIDDIRFKIRAQYRMLQDIDALITAESVKAAYLGIHALQKGYTLNELTEYYKKIWEQKIEFKNYKTTIEYLHRFIESKYSKKDVYLSELSMEFATEFEYYLRHHPMKEHDPCLGNGVAKHIQRFKRIVNWAVDDLQWLKNNPFEKYSCPIKKTKRKKLPIEQLVLLEQKTFQDATLNYVRDLFLFSCYTGFAFADVMQLTPSHFEWETDGTIWCKTYRMKSDILSPIPLIKDAADLINKYRNHPDSLKSGRIFPDLSNQHVNRCLKIIKEACEFTNELTFHMARHTFAKTVALKNGIPIETIQIMLGHTKITTTLIYAEVDEEKVLDDMSGLEEKLKSKRAIVIDKWQHESVSRV